MTFQHDEQGCTLHLSRHGDETVTILWSQIATITAFKQDLFNPQIVILEIMTIDGDAWEVDAVDVDGFANFGAVLEQYCSGMPSHNEWWPRVTDPLGRQEDTVLYTAP